MFDDFVKFFNILLHLTPHSMRAGGATKRKLDNVPVPVIQEEGRWEHVKTAKLYIDIVFARMPEVLAQDAKVPALTAANFADMMCSPW